MKTLSNSYSVGYSSILFPSILTCLTCLILCVWTVNHSLGNEPISRHLAISQETQDQELEAIFKIADQRDIPRIAINDARVYSKDFQKHGDKGFRAVCLLIESGNHGGTRYLPLLEKTWKPGLEKELLELSKRDLRGYGAWIALMGLGFADTPEVRDYLLGRLKVETDAGLFMSTATGLSYLKEKKAVEATANQLLKFEDGWSGVESHLIGALPRMDLEASVPLLEKYLLDDRSQLISYPLNKIAELDKVKAQELSTQILDERKNLTAFQKWELEKFVKKK